MKKPFALTAIPLVLALFTTPGFAAAGHHGGERHHADKEHSRHDKGRHLGWHKKAWKRGDRIVWVDVEPRYYVTDYRVYHLAPPPSGYRWVRPIDDHYLLVNIATGLIVQALGY